jgi:hypothetical protein
MQSIARILFDEAHSEAWTIRPELAQTMQPAHPADSSYVAAGAALIARSFTVAANVENELSAETLTGYDSLVIAHPSDPDWERTTGTGSPRLSAGEIDAVVAFVHAGGGLIVLGETEQAKYGNNLNELLQRFGIELRNDTVQDYEHHRHSSPSWILAELGGGERGRGGDLLSGVREACFYRATTIATTNGARVLARAHASASVPGAPLIVSSEHGAGRVVVLADSDLFGDDCIDALDHRTLWLNITSWVTRPEGQRAADPAPDLPEGWETLRNECNALALLQSSDGSLLQDASHAEAAGRAEAIAEALRTLAPAFPHQAEYLECVLRDLRGWVHGGFAKPDFTAALDAFRPDQGREDGRRHLVFFPMYKQNGSRDTCYEALVIRVPWPEWIAQLERERYDNAKFVPVQLLDATRGYDSDCAVLFPETVSVIDRPVNHFGAIFCDREAERLRRVAGAAAELLSLNLPPDCARMLADPEISEQAYILWDLIHDRAHSHGELPFDPFMIRQRAPYWMYSLEELRCDLTTFMQARRLESEGLAFGRYVQYAIVLDRLLRFPITGTRVRNYDGLGGQLLFAHLHGLGHVGWEDNRLTIDWEQVADGVGALHAEVTELYRRGIDRTKLGHWAAAHDLVAARVPAASGSRWAAAVRELPDLEDPRPYCDLVLGDEFPLSIFYSALRAKLAV